MIIILDKSFIRDYIREGDGKIKEIERTEVYEAMSMEIIALTEDVIIASPAEAGEWA